MRNTNHTQTLLLTLSSMLLAIMLILGYVESLLPSPGVPGIKLGLSNSVLIFAVWMLDIPTAYILMSLKVILSGLMFGGVSTMIYAYAGGLVSLTGMILLKRLPNIHPIVVSMAGGLLHNAGQVVTAMLILHTPRQMLGYMGILMLVGLLCGALTGVAASGVMRHLKAVSWRAPQKRGSGFLPVLLAVILIAAGFYFAWHGISQVSQSQIQISTQAVPLLPGDAPPF